MASTAFVRKTKRRMRHQQTCNMHSQRAGNSNEVFVNIPLPLFSSKSTWAAQGLVRAASGPQENQQGNHGSQRAV
jgi:hypothetical protein